MKVPLIIVIFSTDIIQIYKYQRLFVIQSKLGSELQVFEHMGGANVQLVHDCSRSAGTVLV